MDGKNAVHDEFKDKAYDPPNLPAEITEQPTNIVLAFLFWIKSWAIPGMGMFCEAYFIFSIGNIDPLISKEYPDCWKSKLTHPLCTTNLVNTVTYIQIVGIILGMLTLGYVGDQIGRKWGSVTTASIMTLGAGMLISSDGVTVKGFVIMFMVSQFVFGYGVGGEYPMASTSANERAEATKVMRDRRGEMVVCTFAMQGWGNFTNTVVLVILLVIWGETGSKYSGHKLGAIWRTSFALGLIPLIFMIWFRVFKLHESRVWKKELEKKQDKGTLYRNFFYHYWHRLIGCALSWFFWDVSFYGNKLFQSTFIAIISGKNASILTGLLWTMCNSGVALVGYYFAAFTVDKRWWGRVRMQVFGFAMVFLLFLFCAVFYNKLIETSHIKWFQALYFLSSFFGQWGPNATTWLLPGEVFPTDVRATAHGICAAVGKCGALLAGVWFNYIGSRKKFWVTSFFNLAGMILTLLFVPDVMRLPLSEGDRRWRAIMMGNVKSYTGEAVAGNNLSLFERFTGVGRVYNPELDARARAEESNASYPSGSIESTEMKAHLEMI